MEIILLRQWEAKGTHKDPIQNLVQDTMYDASKPDGHASSSWESPMRIVIGFGMPGYGRLKDKG